VLSNVISQNKLDNAKTLGLLRSFEQLQRSFEELGIPPKFPLESTLELSLVQCIATQKDSCLTEHPPCGIPNQDIN
jgi:hypothetical protein